MSRRRKVRVAQFIDASRWRVPAQDAAARLRERDERLHHDNRNEIARWLGDPPPGRSALSNNVQRSAVARGTSWRVDLWRNKR
jgi:hypothetical protein